MTADPAGAPVRTVGHGTLDAAAFAGLLRGMGVDVIVDVRRFPGSRRLPHFAAAEMRAWLPDHGLAYRWLPSLGGRRRAEADSPNTGLRNAQFRGYADHMVTREFADGVGELLRLAAQAPVAVMCAESVWWRCHRRLLADHLVLIEQRPVEHGFHDGRLAAHRPTPQARPAAGQVVYDAAGG